MEQFQNPAFERCTKDQAENPDEESAPVSEPSVTCCKNCVHDEWQMDKEAVILDSPLCVLGQGSFGTVCTGRVHGLPVAVKMPTYADDTSKKTAVNSIIRESYVLRRAQHPNVVLSHGIFGGYDEGTWWLVLEKINGLQMREMFHNFPGALQDRKSCHNILEGIAQALRHLHNLQPCIVHGDLKPANIMIEGWGSKPRAKIIDFGLSHIAGWPSVQLSGTVRWCAPEVLSAKVPSEPCPSMDMFSFSRILYFVATGTLPFGTHDLEALRCLVASGCKPALLWGQMDVYGEQCRTLSNMMSQSDAKQRLTSDKLPGHLLAMSRCTSGKCNLTRQLPHKAQHAPKCDIAVWCSMETPDFVVLSCTPKFASMVQFDPVNCKMIDWIVDSKAFLFWSTISTGLAYRRKKCLPELVTLRAPGVEVSIVLEIVLSSFANDAPPSYALFKVLEYKVLSTTDLSLQL